MITVAGEALMDLVLDASGTVTALPGGAPFNVARMIAQLGGECQFLGRLSDDAFGVRLRAALVRDGVGIATPEPCADPTTLAVAQLDATGAAAYRFYLDSTAAGQLREADVPVGILRRSNALALGGLGLVLEPTASTLDGLIARRPPVLTTLLDPNCRPGAIRNERAYRATVDRFVSRVDIVKVSTEDLRILRPEQDVHAAARSVLALGARAVLVTDADAPVGIYTVAAECSVPVPAVEVVDTIGAGDAFVAAFLTWWMSRGLTPRESSDIDALVGAATAAVFAAAADCTMRGANLPDDFVWPGDDRATSVPLAGA